MRNIIKYFGLLLILLLIIGAISVFVRGSDISKNNVTQSQEQKPSEANNDEYKMYFSFDGNKKQTIELNEGKADLNMVYNDDSEFAAKILKTDGTMLAMLIETNGPYNGIHIIDVPEKGIYILDVKTTGHWSLSRK